MQLVSSRRSVNSSEKISIPDVVLVTGRSFDHMALPIIGPPFITLSGRKQSPPQNSTTSPTVVPTGTSTFDADTSDATATAAEILSTKTAYVNGNKVTGSMPNRGAVTGTITTKTQQYTIPQGYHDGSGKVSISATEQAKLIPENIRQGITILSIEGTMSGTEDMDIEPAKTVTPQTAAQTILPATGYDGMAQVTVEAIPVTRTENAQGGVTVSIAAA